jgi:hypothetical protein
MERSAIRGLSPLVKLFPDCASLHPGYVGYRGAATILLSTAARLRGNLRRSSKSPEDAAAMSKPTKTEAELIEMAKAELKVHADCPDGIVISVIRDGDSWEFRAEADEATVAKPGFPECVAMLVQVGDHLSKQYDFKD